MVRLRPRAEHRLLGLDEVPEVHALGEAGARSQACERPDHRVGAHLGFLDHRGESNVDPVTDDGVDEVRSAVDATAGAEARPAAQHDVRSDHRVTADRDLRSEVGGGGILEGDAFRHPAVGQLGLERCFHGCELRPRVDAGHLVGALGS